ncbi:MAG: hypothetical protein WKG01_31540 [Kofleriaceae bacterium]
MILLDSTFSGAPANPSDKNLAFYKPPSSSTKLPVSVNLAHGNTGLFTACLNGPTGCATGGTPSSITTCDSIDMLEDTGFDDPLPNQCAASSVVGGGTGWLVTKGNVVPGEIITLRIAVWDMVDSSFDSLAVLDGFRWKTTRATPGTTAQ